MANLALFVASVYLVLVTCAVIAGSGLIPLSYQVEVGLLSSLVLVWSFTNLWCLAKARLSGVYGFLSLMVFLVGIYLLERFARHAGLAWVDAWICLSLFLVLIPGMVFLIRYRKQGLWRALDK